MSYVIFLKFCLACLCFLIADKARREVKRLQEEVARLESDAAALRTKNQAKLAACVFLLTVLR
jgi:hypothetical protein